MEGAARERGGLLGRNGAGKTTTLTERAWGSCAYQSGSISLDSTELLRMPPDEIPRRGVAYVPQGRRLFPDMTVSENLRMGLLVRGGRRPSFSVLRERMRQSAGTLSGGEQQMLATARALCARPTHLLMDEPSEGLMPTLVDRLLETVCRRPRTSCCATSEQGSWREFDARSAAIPPISLPRRLRYAFWRVYYEMGPKIVSALRRRGRVGRFVRFCKRCVRQASGRRLM